MIRICTVTLALIVAPFASAAPDPSEFAARTVVRLALFDLRLNEEQTPADYELAWYLLGIAERLQPEDEHIVRMRLEAAYGMGDDDAVLDQTRKILRLDPDDEIAKLRLITSQITKRQIVDERIAIYEGLVGEKGVNAGLSPALRSRLSLDAAILKREQGDLEGFVTMLDKATSLDSTNKDAAMLALTFYSESVDDPIGRLDLLANLLYADPVDPQIHDAIMRELAAGGAWRGAVRFFNTQAQIITAAGRTLDETLMTNGLVLTWQGAGPELLVEQLNQSLKVQRDRAEQYLRMLVREQQPTDDVPRPDEIRLPFFQDLARVLAADAAGDAPTLDAAVADMTASARFQVMSLRDPQVVGEQVPPETIALAETNIRNQLWTIRLWVGHGLDQIEKDLATIDEQRDSDDTPESPAVTAFRGWLALQKGDAAGGLTILEGIEQTSAFIELGKALARIELGDQEAGLESLANQARLNPLSPLGAWSQSRYEKITGEEFVMAPNRERLDAWADGIPGWLDRIPTQAERFITFEVMHDRPVISVLDRAGIRLRIKNTSRIPLGFGPKQPISSSIMVVPRTDVGIENMAGNFEPEVFDIQRRLRLNPLETIEVELWPDPGQTGYFAEMMTSITARTRWRAVQGYTITPDRIYRAGPMGLSRETGAALTRLPLSESDHSFEELARRVRNDSEASLPMLLATTRSKIQEFVGVGAPMEQVAQILAPVIQALVSRYPSCTPESRLMIAATLQSSFFFPPLQPLEELIKADENPAIRMLSIFNRVTDPTDPLLAEAAASGDPDMERVALLIQQRHESNRPMISKMRPRGRR